MGDALSSATCCAGRDQGFELKRRAREKMALESDALDDDVTRFDRAYDANDTRAFIEMLGSNQPIDQLEERMHPWAADPQTVGALCATQLAILASREKDSADIKDTIRHHKGIPGLVRLLDSKEEDRVHAATIALSFLSVDNIENCVEMGEQGALRMLIKGMKSPLDGMRAASAQTCRNIYVLDMRYRFEFERLGGLKALLGLLEILKTDDPSPMYTRIEALYHLEDLIFKDEPSVAEIATKLLELVLDSSIPEVTITEVH
eukprot:Selendium_serpulae@DN5223_c0_g1_i1.p1